MEPAEDVRGQQRYARIAGATYLVSMALFVAPNLIMSGIAVRGDFAQSAANAVASEPLYRFALAAQVAGCATIVVLAWAFYALVRDVAPRLSLFALLCRSVEAGLMCVGSVLWFAALRNYTAEAAGGDPALGERIDGVLSAGINASFHISMVLLSVGSMIFFYLLMRSRRLPRMLAGFDIAAAALALAFALALMIAPQAAANLGMAGWIPIFIAEIATGLWLLIAGAGTAPEERPNQS